MKVNIIDEKYFEYLHEPQLKPGTWYLAESRKNKVPCLVFCGLKDDFYIFGIEEQRGCCISHTSYGWEGFLKDNGVVDDVTKNLEVTFRIQNKGVE